ncbi:hypothetical protein CK203_057622 [Vitis vinifera]|uniref:Uncharacterized protein n=1 Tax=Vitis vinifera TaxID=29760 RepID=A0A438GNH0_VITVI|nr:hypothetical protein CK203_057622 [Vitis vinifera]
MLPYTQFISRDRILGLKGVLPHMRYLPDRSVDMVKVHKLAAPLGIEPRISGFIRGSNLNLSWVIGAHGSLTNLLLGFIVIPNCLPSTKLRPPHMIFHTLTTTTIWTYHTTGLHSLIFTTTPSSVSPIGRGLCLTWSERDYATFCLAPVRIADDTQARIRGLSKG